MADASLLQKLLGTRVKKLFDLHPLAVAPLHIQRPAEGVLCAGGASKTSTTPLEVEVTPPNPVKQTNPQLEVPSGLPEGAVAMTLDVPPLQKIRFPLLASSTNAP